MLSLPALAGQAIDPLAQLMETAYIGRLGGFRLPPINDQSLFLYNCHYQHTVSSHIYYS